MAESIPPTAKQQAEMTAELKKVLAAVTLNTTETAKVNTEVKLTNKWKDADKATQEKMLSAALETKRLNKEADTRERIIQKDEKKRADEKRALDEKITKSLEDMTGLGKFAQRAQLKAAKLAQTAKGKVVDFAKDKINGIKKAAGSLMDLLGKGLGLAALYLVFEAIKKWDIMGLWESAKNIGTFLGTFGNFFLTLGTSISAWMGFEMLKGLFTKKEGKLTRKIKDLIVDIKFWMMKFTGKDSFLGKLGNMFKSFMGVFGRIPGVQTILKFVKGAAKFLGKIFLPVTIIMALYDAVMGAISGFQNTEGNMFQKIIGGIGGAIKGLLDFFIFSIADAIQSVIIWIGEFFGFDMSAISDFDLVGKIREWVGRAIDFITDMFSWNTEGKVGKESDFGNLLSWISKTWDEVVAWVKGVFSWASEGISEGWTSLTGYVSEIWNKVVKWISKVLSWGDDSIKQDDEDGIIISTLKKALTGIKEWFGKMFKFDSVSNILASMINVLTFFPNMIKDAIAGVTTWLLELFGFGDAAKKVANANKFSIGDMIMNVLKSIGDFISGMFDFDFKTMATGLISTLPYLVQKMIPTDFITGLVEPEKKQYGGPVVAGEAVMVGEVGPELFVPSMSGKIIPNTKSEQMVNSTGGGGMVNAPTTIVTNNSSSSSGMMMTSSSIDPMHAKYFRN